MSRYHRDRRSGGRNTPQPLRPSPSPAARKPRPATSSPPSAPSRRIEQEQRPATPEERQALARFAGFGPVALSIFPDPVTGRYKDAGWQALGEELKTLLTPEEYDSAKRTTFNAFYTSPTVIAAMHEALARLGVPANATVLEPGCGTGNFMSQAPEGMRFIGVELDPSPAASPGRSTPARTSASRTSATPACPRTASTR